MKRIHRKATPDYRWSQITPKADFAPRDGAGALVFKNRLWLLGGWNPHDKVHFPRICNNEIWSSIDGAEWKLEDLHAPWEARHCAGYVLHRDRMWIVGGDANQGHYQNDVWNSADGVNWNRVTDAAPWGPRVLHYTVSFKDRIWVMGGQASPRHAPGDEIFYADVWNSADGATWERVADRLPWGPRSMIAGSMVFKDRMWILGGGTFESPKRPDRIFYNDAWSSADGIQWDRIAAETPWHPRQFHDAIVFDRKMWVLEGWHKDAGNRKDVWCSSDGANWIELPNTPWAPRHAASVYVYDNALWIVAGNNMEPDVWKLERA
jgi:hypothetical protein